MCLKPLLKDVCSVPCSDILKETSLRCLLPVAPLLEPAYFRLLTLFLSFQLGLGDLAGQQTQPDEIRCLSNSDTKYNRKTVPQIILESIKTPPPQKKKRKKEKEKKRRRKKEKEANTHLNLDIFNYCH